MAFWCCCKTGGTMYALGGFTGATVPVVTADKIDMSADTAAAVTTANLTVARGILAGVANPGTAGYFIGGRSSTGGIGIDTTLCDKLTFASDTTSAATTANLPVVRETYAAISERSTKAYVAGGRTNANPNFFADAYIITFSSDTTAAQTTANLSQARGDLAGMTEGTTKGYWAGGVTSTGGNEVVTADKITFSTDTTTAQTTANLSLKRRNLGYGSDGSTKGYWAGGFSGAVVVSTTDKITFSADTTAALTSVSFPKEAGSCGSDGTRMLSMGGFTTSANTNNGFKITFATDTEATVSATLSSARLQGAGCSTVAL